MIVIKDMSLSFEWAVEPSAWEHSDSALTIRSGPGGELFADPAGVEPLRTSPRLLAKVSGDFQFSARVTVEHRSLFDAGVLVLWADEDRWVKLCFERSADGRSRVVSVVNRGVSDDCDSFVVPGGSVRYRISRLGRVFALHASPDVASATPTWQFVRQFFLVPEGEDVFVGFSAQSPNGDGCTAAFDDIRFARDRLADLRDGS
jgi:regulation of enolase protein 1 (concanavalin A-like superfamily)